MPHFFLCCVRFADHEEEGLWKLWEKEMLVTSISYFPQNISFYWTFDLSSASFVKMDQLV